MATDILSVAASAASSDDVEIAAGESATFALKGVEDGAQVIVELLDDAGDYHPIGSLTASVSERAVTINAPGTFRFRRLGGKACGVFRA